jgi:hypothetical protein
MAADGVELAAAVHGDGDVEFVVASPGEGGVELVVASTLRLGRARATGGCIRAAVEHLSFPDNSFDVTLAVTVV